VNQGGDLPAGKGDEEGLDLLRAKYLDYCSARLADLLLHLSPDEIFVLSEKVASGDPESRAPGYGHIVRVATEWLAERVPLPSFEVWLRDYRADPERFDNYLMGLWEESGPDRPS
jgi:hypothetical protein